MELYQQQLSTDMVEKLEWNKFYNVCKETALKRMNEKILHSTKSGKQFFNLNFSIVH